MDSHDLAAIEARANAATPGPWRANCLDEETNCWQVDEPMVTAHGDGDYLNAANAKFIAAAREDVPALLAEVRRLDAKLLAVYEACRRADMPSCSDLAAHIDIMREERASFCEESKRLRVEVERLSAERDEARAEAEKLRVALVEIARPKRGGIELSSTDDAVIDYWRGACERERRTAREALAPFVGVLPADPEAVPATLHTFSAEARAALGDTPPGGRPVTLRRNVLPVDPAADARVEVKP